MSIPEAKLPHLNLPAIRSVPTLPLGIGCTGADANSYLGQQFGNLPNLQKLLHLKTVRKALTEQVYALIQGKLPDPLRPIPYAARAAQLLNELIEVADGIVAVVEEVTGDIAAAVSYVDQQVATVNELKGLIEGVPELSRSAVQTLMLARYNRYAQELNAQKARLQSALECVS